MAEDQIGDVEETEETQQLAASAENKGAVTALDAAVAPDQMRVADDPAADEAQEEDAAGLVAAQADDDADQVASASPAENDENAVIEAQGENDVIEAQAEVIDDGLAPSEANKAAEAALGVAKEVASALRAGVFAVRDVHHASKQSADARAQARTIQDALVRDRATLGHRKQIEASFDQIVSVQAKIVEDSKASIEADQQKIDGLAEERSALVADLDELKASNASAIRPYKHLIESSKSELDDAQRTLTEAKRAVKTAESQLKEAKERRDSSYAIANRSYDNSQTRQRKVQEELRRLQSSGGSAAAISQLQSDNVAALAGVDSAKAEVARASKDGQSAVDNAQTHLWAQNQSLASAQAKYDDAKAKHEAHKAEHDKMADNASAEEKKLQERINEKKRLLDSLRSKVDQTQKVLDEAQGLIDEAQLIRSTPQETKRLEESIASQQADLDEANSEVEHLAATEKELRQATRGSRAALIAVAAAVVLVLVFVVVSCAGGAK
ncbi:hypothetical protein [Paratractidigestivibacter sp.]|uniref:hypothetical protein n=1 Tax=Paratractidigestivibacter sp. TaxID=2847316 RepID=UPI002ABD9F5D|nr:hypothetical protein [Paratractidigestivibacter sp.]